MPSLLFRENKHLGLAHLYNVLDNPLDTLPRTWFSNIILMITGLLVGLVGFSGILAWAAYSVEHPVLDFKSTWITSKTGVDNYSKTTTTVNGEQVFNLEYVTEETRPSAYIYQLAMIMSNVENEKADRFNVTGYDTAGNLITEVRNYPTADEFLHQAQVALEKTSSLTNTPGKITFKAEVAQGTPKFSIQKQVYSLANTQFENIVRDNLTAFTSNYVGTIEAEYSLAVGLFTESLSPVFYEQTFTSNEEALQIYANAMDSTWTTLQSFFLNHRGGEGSQTFFSAKPYAGDSTLEVILPQERWIENGGNPVLSCGFYYAPPAAFCPLITP